MSKKIVFASDHAGYELKQQLKVIATQWGYHLDDVGTNSSESVDYPDFADRLAKFMETNSDFLGVAICGTGIGISIAANRHRHIRAAVCRDVTDARLAREHNNANVICLGARTSGFETAKDALKIFVESVFEGGRHAKRVDKLA